jgi:hypothetical protein
MEQEKAQEKSLQICENKANIELLEKRLDAIIKILNKEGITTKEEVESMTKDMIEGREPDD